MKFFKKGKKEIMHFEVMDRIEGRYNRYGDSLLHGAHNISYEQFTIIRNFAKTLRCDKLIPFIKHYAHDAYRFSDKARYLVKHFDKHFIKGFKKLAQNRCMLIALTDIDRSERLHDHGRKTGIFTKIKEKAAKYFVKYGHASRVVYDPQKKKVRLGHINPGPQVNDFLPENYLGSSVLGLEMEKLLTDEGGKCLQNCYAEKGQGGLEVKDIVKLLDEELCDISRKSYLQISQFPIIASAEDATLQGCISVLMGTLPFGHNLKLLADNVENALKLEEVKDKSNIESMMCSTFVANTILRDIAVLKERMRTQCPDCGGIFKKMPLEGHEQLRFLHPNRLRDILLKSGMFDQIFIDTDYMVNIDESPSGQQLKHYFPRSKGVVLDKRDPNDWHLEYSSPPRFPEGHELD